MSNRNLIYNPIQFSEEDFNENIHKRELELGAATMTALIFLIDKYGLASKIKL